MAKSATDLAIETFAAAEAPALQTLPIAVYLTPESVDAICGALNQSADALMLMAGEDRFKGQPRKDMIAVERDCRETAHRLRHRANVAIDPIGLTQQAIDQHRTIMDHTRAKLEHLHGITKTSYVRSRLDTCRRLLKEASARLIQPPVIAAAKTPKAATRKAAQPKAKPAQTNAQPPKTVSPPKRGKRR